MGSVGAWDAGSGTISDTGRLEEDALWSERGDSVYYATLGTALLGALACLMLGAVWRTHAARSDDDYLIELRAA